MVNFNVQQLVEDLCTCTVQFFNNFCSVCFCVRKKHQVTQRLRGFCQMIVWASKTHQTHEAILLLVLFLFDCKEHISVKSWFFCIIKQFLSKRIKMKFDNTHRVQTLDTWYGEGVAHVALRLLSAPPVSCRWRTKSARLEV